MVNRRKRDENRAVRRAFVYSKSMEFVVVKILQSSERTVIDWKFCSKRIKFLSTWNTFKRSSRVYAFDDMVLQQRKNCNCQSSYIAFHPCFFPSFTFFPLDQMVQRNGRLKMIGEKLRNVKMFAATNLMRSVMERTEITRTILKVSRVFVSKVLD